MKRKIFIMVITFLLSSSSFSQQIYKDNYILPEAIKNNCENNNPFIFTLFDIGDIVSFHTYRIRDCAQLFESDTLLTITGACVVLWNMHMVENIPLLVGVSDTSLKMKEYQKIYTHDGDSPKDFVPYEVFFENPINVYGNYYLVLDSPKPVGMAEYPENEIISWEDFIDEQGKAKVILLGVKCLHKGKQSVDVCGSNKQKWRSTVDIYTFDEVGTLGEWRDTVMYNGNGLGIYMFPIFGPTDSTVQCIGCENLPDTPSSERMIDVGKYVVIFPNPSSREVCIQSSWRINSIDVFNDLGQNVEQIEVDRYYYLLDLSRYTSGNYLLKIKTVEGIATKQLLVQ